MKIQILGTGCPKCKQLAVNAEQAVRELGMNAEVVKVTSIKEIMQFKVLTTPALAVDGVVKSAGSVPRADEIKKLLA